MQDVVNECWVKAVDYFNDRLTRDRQKKVKLQELGKKFKCCTLGELAREIEADRRPDCVTDQGWKKTLRSIIRKLHDCAEVGDVLIAPQPLPAAVVWGTIRLCLQLGASYIQFLDDIGQHLVVIVGSTGLYEQVARTFKDHPEILDQVAVYFAHILCYLVRLDIQLSRRKVAQVLRGSVSPKLNRCYNELQTLELQLDQRIKHTSFEQHINFIFVKLENRPLFYRISEPTLIKLSNVCTIRKLKLQHNIQVRDAQAVEMLHNTVKWLEIAAPLSEPSTVEPTPGTGEWIFSDPTWIRWKTATVDRWPLWIKGDTGVGKTVLAHTLVTALRQETVLLFPLGTENRRRGDQIRQLFLSMLLRICRSGLLHSYHDIAPWLEKVKRFRSAFGHAGECGTQQLAQITQEIVSFLPPVTLIIDALDQCSESQDSELLERTLTAISTNVHHSVILTSRKQPIIQNSYMIEMTPDKTKSDIELFARQEISRYRGLLQPIQDDILRRIERDCLGSFLWVHLLLNHVRQGPSLQTRRRKLLTFPTELQRVYEEVIRETACSFEEQDKTRQKHILWVLAAAREPLTLRTLFSFIGGHENEELMGSPRNDEDMAVDVDGLCHPLVRVRAPYVYLTHPTLKEYIYKDARSEGPDLFLAKKCLEKLNNEMYQSWKIALRLLRKHLLPPHMITGNDDPQPLRESVLYEYAVLHWHEHMTALRRPPDDILGLLAQFLRGIQAVTWSENLFEAKHQSGLAPQLEVQTMLKTWYEGLDEGTQQKIPIKDYFVKPHERLQKELKEKAQDNVAPYLPFMRLGQFFNLGGRSRSDWRKGFWYKEAVAEGLESTLGARHPLTLQTKTSMLQEFFWQGRFVEAEQELSRVAATQREIYNQDSLDVYVTVQLLGYAQYSCAKFNQATASLMETEEGFKRLQGENSANGLVTRLYQGYVQEKQGNLTTARTNYDKILREWSPIGGDAHPLCIMSRTALGMVCRKLKEHATAEEALLDAWRQRRRVFGDDLNLTVDTALALALEYRDNAKLALARQVLDAIKSSEVFAADFERTCQLQYISSLIEFDRGYYNRPRMVLQRLVDQSTGISREDNNRSLLWIRLTLANVLRQHEHPDEAAALFSEIVEPIDEIERRFYFTPEPPERLEIAEKALRLVQQSRQGEAKALLQANKLQWVRERDFDILQGGPITDTAVVKPVVTIATEP
ncbi:uncharacterized protein Z520_05633 [Fonsecaea multimorphosa CBS 102226]|uniref:Nephrocystin 3-like N-terminal domain-containing protein n=1 Tax=Fonsecaea multimorphosa CBS 102226 TaxID=1442371 RepID=A0A0D2JXS3_9EURO|nr:uncharacterized protein Z520_05633 [Fonsecaea multimorphosa CBS 102226]KIX98332.1 hypothetical protein Z520_05633 [Fonsecaea multimorphosa CBS 102226]